MLLKHTLLNLSLGGEVSVQGEPSVQGLEELKDEWPRKIELELSLDKAAKVIGHDLLFVEIANVLAKHRGPVPVELVMLKGGRFQTRMSVGKDYHVQPSPQLITELSNIISVPDFIKIKKEF